MRAPARLARIGRVLRAAWLLVGAVALLLLVAEGAYRAQGALRRAIGRRHAGDYPLNPYVDGKWFDELMIVRWHQDERLEWRPYIEVRQRPFRSTYLTIDSTGRRRTVQPAPPGLAARKLYLFGGSTMFGSMLRDSATIPSRIAAEFATRGLRDVAVVNYGEIGHAFTQEALELLLELRAGARPDAVVFLDGGNEVLSAVQAGRAGIPLLEGNRSRDYELGRLLFSWRTDLRAEAGVALRLGGIALGRLRLLAKLRHSSASLVPTPAVDALADDVVRTYLGTLEWVEALAVHYGFVAFYAWEPELFTTRKRLSPFERQLTLALESDPANSRLRSVRRLVPERLAPAAAAAVPGRFANFTGLFDGDTATTFVDEGHTTESASAKVAAELARRLAPYFERPPRRRLGAREPAFEARQVGGSEKAVRRNSDEAGRQ